MWNSVVVGQVNWKVHRMKLNRLSKWVKLQWSTSLIVTFCLYGLFILVVLSISFPLKSKSKIVSPESDRVNGIGLFGDDSLGANEQKLLQRANDLPAINNRTDVLRVAFRRWVWANAHCAAEKVHAKESAVAVEGNRLQQCAYCEWMSKRNVWKFSGEEWTIQCLLHSMCVVYNVYMRN